MENKQKAIILIAVMVVAMTAVVVVHADPAQTLIGMLIGVFVLVVIVNGGKKRILVNRMGSEIQQEIAQGTPYSARVPTRVVALLREGKEMAAISALREATGAGLFEAKNQVDELRLRIEMGQSINCELG